MCRVFARQLVLCFLSALLASSSVQAAPVRLNFRLASDLGDIEAREARLLLTRAAPQAGETVPEVVKRNVSIPGLVVLDLPPGSWQATLQTDDFWTSSRLLEVVPEGASSPWKLWPMATLKGKVQLPRGAVAPDKMTLRFTPAAQKPAEDAPTGSLSCPILNGQFSCKAPAMSLDLRLRAPGFMTHYRWAFEASAFQVVDLGSLVLRPGASVVGWVTTETGPLPSKVQVELLPLGLATVKNQIEEAQRQTLMLTGPVNEKGFFHLDDVPPGEHVVTARAEGWAPSSTAVLVLEDRESELREPLVLTPPVKLAVVVDPPTQPSGQAWLLEIGRMDRYRQTLVDAQTFRVPQEGWWEGLGFSRGPYLLRLLGTADEAMLVRNVDVGEEPLPIQLEVTILEVAGTVKLGDTPLAAEIYFGGRHGALQVRTASDEDGYYEAVLPRPGEWKVEVLADEPRVRRELVSVKVPEPSGRKPIELDLKLPDTSVTGRVVKEDGSLPDRGVVEVVSLEDEGPALVWDRLDESAEFAFHGLPEGRASFSARADELESDRVEVQLVEGVEQPELLLILREHMRIEGTVVSSSGPVPGAKISLTPLEGTIFSAGEVISGPDGRFEVSLPAKTQRAEAIVGAPGFALRTFEVDLAPEQTLLLEVGQIGGTLMLEAPDEAFQAFGRSEAAVLFQDGRRIPWRWLEEWAAVHPTNTAQGNLEIASMHPGFYQLCRVQPSETEHWMRHVLRPENCLGGELGATSVLSLGWLPSEPSHQNP